MSRTDKDVPYRVAVEREGTERHDHRFGGCDFTPEMSVNERLPLAGYRYRWTCGLEISGRYSYTLTFFPRTSSVRAYRERDLGFERRELREWSRGVQKLARAGEWDAVVDADVPPLTGRHNALWEAW